MLWDNDYIPQWQEEERHASNHFANRGEDLIQEAALAAIEQLRSLPAAQAEAFASSFKKGIERLTIAQERLLATLVQMPLELLEPLKEANL